DMEPFHQPTLTISTHCGGPGDQGGSIIGAAKLSIGYLERRDKDQFGQTAQLIDAYHEDQERMTGTLIEVMVAMECLALCAWMSSTALGTTSHCPRARGKSSTRHVHTFVLLWGVGRWVRPRPLSPIEQLIDESRPLTVRLLRAAGRVLLAAYAITLVISVVNAPLLIADQNLVSPVGLLIGPPVVVLTSVALVAGFLLMLVSPLGLATPFAVVTRWSLVGCEAIVEVADGLPGGSAYVPGVPTWWVAVFYLGVAGVVLFDRLWRRRAAAGVAVWVLIGLALPPRFGPSDELRVTVLSVGHGGCAVIETPDGRCLVYDAGSTAGPGVVRRVVAPYLWSRGVRRVDELFVSHADADHFNGIGELLRRFPVGQVTLTPSFAEKPTGEVAAALLELERHGVPQRLAVAGDRFVARDVELEVLHPPPVGPPGVENERSLVLHVCHAGHSILLTGDLEKSGTGFVLDQIPKRSDVLMAPHHGSKAAFPKRLTEWADPKFVVVSRGPGFSSPIQAGAAGPDVPVWDTVSMGAITLRSHRSGLTAEAFRTGERRVLVRGGP
ncbi:MAG TPA: MBL fold metallo-hydrolase, partial [Fimbriiglobus sp.]|nr:MBL fold metallo-hydrolase [Fimbriiglobus sp.]